MEQDPSGWRMLVGCILLNQTSRKQVDGVRTTLFELFPTARQFVEAGEDEVTKNMLIETLHPLGLHNRRAVTLQDLGEWWERHDGRSDIDIHVVDLDPPGVGEYARDSWLIFKVGPTDKAVDLFTKLFASNSSWPADKELKEWMRPCFEEAEIGEYGLNYDMGVFRRAWAKKLGRES